MNLPSKCANLVCCIWFIMLASMGTAQAQVFVTIPVNSSTPPKPIFIVDSDPASPTFNSVTSTVDDNQLRGADSMAFSPDGAYAYLTGDVPGIQVVNLLFNSVDGFIDTGFASHEGRTNMDVGPDGIGYVAGGYRLNPRVVVVNTIERSVVATIPLEGSVPPNPESVAVRPDGAVVYVLVDSDSNVARILVISAVTREIVATIPVPRNSTGVSFTPDGAYAYVKTIRCGPNVQIIDTLANQVVGEVPETPCANDIAFRPDGGAAYITNFNLALTTGSVRVVDTGRRSVVATIRLSDSATWTYGITVSSVGYAYVEANNQDNTQTIFVIYTLSNNVVGTVSGLTTGFPGLMKAM